MTLPATRPGSPVHRTRPGLRWASPRTAGRTAMLCSILACQPVPVPRGAGSMPVAPARQADRLAGIDSLFAEWATGAGPGCVVGATQDGQPLFLRAYGLADLEHAVPNAAHTVFEAGSVSKQFTAAAILLLVADGELQLTDDIRIHLPALPRWDAVVTVDHLLTHTSGIRDWVTVTALAGLPRDEHFSSMTDVLDLAARQRALNHAPGEYFSYSNTGYVLLAEIVQRVSGMTLQEFSRQRMFGPLGMNATQWRDDPRRVVPHRATAYRRRGTEFIRAMPFESVVGPGGLLTTVGDLLRWNEALRLERLGAAVSQSLQRKLRLNSGRAVRYGRGLWVDRYRGHEELAHGGTTVGYNAWLGRYPGSRLSIGLLCNAPVNDVATARRVADRLLPEAVEPPPSDASRTTAPAVALSPEQAAARAGVFISDVTGLPEIVTAEDGALKNGDEVGRPISANRFRFGWGDLVYESLDRIATEEITGERRTYWRADGPLPSARDLAALAGRYYSPDLGATYVASVEAGRLSFRLEGRSGVVFRTTPVGPDVFRTLTTVWRVHRSPDGGIRSISVSASRLRELHMEPVPERLAR